MTLTAGLSPDDLREIYEIMLLTRALDDRQLRLNRQGRQGIHLSARGHEASGAASARALDPERDVLRPVLKCKTGSPATASRAQSDWYCCWPRPGRGQQRFRV